jgi:two-component system sensor histidine kinase/response regulator
VLIRSPQLIACGAKTGAEQFTTAEAVRIRERWQAVGIVRDIGERQRVMAELEQHRHHLEELVALRTAEVSFFDITAERETQAARAQALAEA